MGPLWISRSYVLSHVCSARLEHTHLHFGIGPPWDFDNHVEDSLLIIGVERNIMKGRHGRSILFNEDAVFECIGRADFSDSIATRGVRVVAPLTNRQRGHVKLLLRASIEMA